MSNNFARLVFDDQLRLTATKRERVSYCPAHPPYSGATNSSAQETLNDREIIFFLIRSW